jgi:hypothetical protein
LDELVVQGVRPRQRMTKEGSTVVAVGRIPGAETSTVYDLLKKLPGVTITEQQGVMLNGKPVSILVDDRELPYVDMVRYMQSLPAASLGEIELIPVKGAERDGHIQSSIVNLKMKKQAVEGYFGNVMALGRLYENKSTVDMANAFIMLKGKKVSFNTSLTYMYSSVKGTGEYHTLLNSHTQPSIVKEGDVHERDSRVEWNSSFLWDIAEGHSLSANFFLLNSRVHTTEQVDYTDFLVNSNSRQANDRRLPRFLGSLNVEYKWEPYLTLSYGYVWNNLTFDEAMVNTYRPDSIVPIRHDEDNLDHQHIVKMDFRKTWNKFTLRAGLKGTFAKQDNSTRYTADRPIAYENIDFTAAENVGGGYATGEYLFSDKVNASLAYRAEYTHYDINNRKLAVTVNPHYWNTYPSARLTYTPSRSYGLVAYLSSAITRPRYGSLLPGQRYDDDYSYSEGNPNLVPSQSYTVGIQHTILRQFNVSMDVTYTKNLISQVKWDKGNGRVANTYMNAIDSRRYNLSVNAPFQFFNYKVSGNLNFSGSTGTYLKARNGFKMPTHHLRPAKINLSGYANYQFLSWMGVNAMVFYNAKDNDLQTVSDPYATVDLGLNMQLLKSRRLSLKMDVSDLFNSVKRSSKVYYEDNVLIQKINIPTRSYTLTISYAFSGGKLFNPQIDASQNETDRFN